MLFALLLFGLFTCGAAGFAFWIGLHAKGRRFGYGLAAGVVVAMLAVLAFLALVIWPQLPPPQNL